MHVRCNHKSCYRDNDSLDSANITEDIEDTVRCSFDLFLQNVDGKCFTVQDSIRVEKGLNQLSILKVLEAFGL